MPTPRKKARKVFLGEGFAMVDCYGDLQLYASQNEGARKLKLKGLSSHIEGAKVRVVLEIIR